jgi:hypothetical protein
MILSDFVLEKCKDVIPQNEKEDWRSNWGKEISGETANAIADRLDQMIKEGEVKRYEVQIMIANLPGHFNEENAKKFADFCRKSRGFDIY